MRGSHADAFVAHHLVQNEGGLAERGALPQEQRLDEDQREEDEHEQCHEAGIEADEAARDVLLDRSRIFDYRQNARAGFVDWRREISGRIGDTDHDRMIDQVGLTTLQVPDQTRVRPAAIHLSEMVAFDRLEGVVEVLRNVVHHHLQI